MKELSQEEVRDIIDNPDYKDWDEISENFPNLPLDLIIQSRYYLNWNIILENNVIPYYYIRNLIPDVMNYLNKIICTQKVGESFIITFQKYLSWDDICVNQDLSEEFILKNIDKFDLNLLLNRYKFSREFLNTLCFGYIDFYGIDWNLLLIHQKLSEDLILKYINRFDKSLIIKHQKVSNYFKKKLIDGDI
jgi:hypothetical protein